MSRVQIIEQRCNVFIRKWLGLPRIFNNSALYRLKGSLQLPLVSIAEIYKLENVRTVIMLKETKEKDRYEKKQGMSSLTTEIWWMQRKYIGIDLVLTSIG